jgi:hypothetical protein
VRPSPTPLGELAQEVDTPVEAQAPIRQDVDPLRLEIRRRVDNSNISRLHKVIRNKQVLPIGADLHVVRSHDALVLVRVVEPLDVVEVRDVQSSDVVSERERKVGKLAVGCDVAVDSKVLARARPEIEEQFCDALLALGISAERVDDPDLTWSDGGRERCRFLVAGDELDVLDALAVGDGDCADDFAAAEFPEAQGVGFLDAGDGGGLQDCYWDYEVGCEDDVLVEVDGEAVGRELLAENVERGAYVFGPLVDDVEVGVCLDKTTGRGANRAAHVRDEETAIGFGAYLIGNGREDAAVGLLELGLVRVGCVEVVCGVLEAVRVFAVRRRAGRKMSTYLGFQQRKESATDQCLAIQ